MTPMYDGKPSQCVVGNRLILAVWWTSPFPRVEPFHAKELEVGERPGVVAWLIEEMYDHNYAITEAEAWSLAFGTKPQRPKGKR